MRFRRKLFVLYGVFLCALLGIWLRVVQLQTLEGDRWEKAARSVRQRTESLQAPRGRIVDRTGAVLAHDERVFQLAFMGWEWERRARVTCRSCGVVRYHKLESAPPKRCACRRYANRDGTTLASKDSETTFDPLPYGNLAPLERALDVPRGTLAGLAAKRRAEVKRLVLAFEKQQRAKGISEFRIDDQMRLKREDLLRRPYVLYTGIPDAAVRLVQLDERGEYRGFRIQTALRRRYPQPGFSPQLLGFTSKVRDEDELKALRKANPGQVTLNSAIGRTGLERAYNWPLAGHVGSLTRERDREGMFTVDVSETPPRAGATVQLSIDVDASLYAQARLAKWAPVEQYYPRTRPSGAFVMIDAITGRALIWAEMPTYDIEKDLDKVFSRAWNDAVVDKAARRWVPRGTLPPGVDRAIWERELVTPAPIARSRVAGLPVEPGSTFKPLIALAALHSGRPLPFGSFRCGHLKMPGCHGCGVVGLEQAIAVSCNQYFSALVRLNAGAFRDYRRTMPTFLEAVGIGRKPGPEVAEWDTGTWLRDWTDFAGPAVIAEAVQSIQERHDGLKLEVSLTRGRGFPRSLGGNRSLVVSIFRDLLLQIHRESGSHRIGIHLSLVENLGSEQVVRFDLKPLDRGTWTHLPLQHDIARFDDLPAPLKRAARRVSAMSGKLRFEGRLARRGKLWFSARFDTRIGRTDNDAPRVIRRDDGWNVGIGQGPVLATPLQLARSMAAIANGGKLVTPRVAWLVNGRIQRPAPAVDLAWEQRHIEAVKAGMHGAVQHGTARNSGIKERVPARVYGKTGTAQVGAAWRPFALPTEVSSTWHHWFVGFAERPGENPVAFACVLHSREEAAAGLTSAKAVADILEYWYTQRAAQRAVPTRGVR